MNEVNDRRASMGRQRLTPQDYAMEYPNSIPSILPVSNPTSVLPNPIDNAFHL